VKPEREHVLSVCRTEWKRIGVPADSRDEMTTELEGDLQDAERDGATALEYVGGDASSFARRWAEERGLARARWHLLVTGLLAIVGGMPGAGLGLFFAYGWSSDTFRERFGQYKTMADGAVELVPFYPPPALILALYALAGLTVAGGAFMAVRSYFAWREDRALRETTFNLLIGTVPAVAAAAGAGITYAWYHDFQDELRVMLGIGLVAALTFALAIAALRALAVYSTRSRGRQPLALPEL